MLGKARTSNKQTPDRCQSWQLAAGSPPAASSQDVSPPVAKRLRNHASGLLPVWARLIRQTEQTDAKTLHSHPRQICNLHHLGICCGRSPVSIVRKCDTNNPVFAPSEKSYLVAWQCNHPSQSPPQNVAIASRGRRSGAPPSARSFARKDFESKCHAVRPKRRGSDAY